MHVKSSNPKPKVLLLGDYSAYFKNLGIGFEQLGWESHYYSHGDYWKKIEGRSYPEYPTNFIGKATRILRIPIDRRQFKGYDLVLFLSPKIVRYRRQAITFASLIRNNGKVVYCSCGSLDPYFQECLSEFNYHPYDHVDIHNRSSEFPKLSISESNEIKTGLIKAHCIVTISETYDRGYRRAGLTTKKIPLPIANISERPAATPSEGPLIVQHGINRRGFKGSDFILDAMKSVGEEFPSKMNVEILEKLPFEEYMKKLSGADIVLDQCKTQGYGMNALLAMAQGKIVLSGNEPSLTGYYGFDHQRIPVINIRPDSNQISTELRTLMMKDSIELHELKQASINYVSQFHDAKKIAEMFAEL